MGRPLRSQQFSAHEVSIIHAVQRCVRRARLAGYDPLTGIDYSFRKEWIRQRIEALASTFGVDVLNYAILSNHMHLVLRNRPDVVACWSDREVAIRWLRVFPGRRLEEHLAEPCEKDVETLVRDQERLAEIRTRLSDFSWFMRALNEPISRRANKQDDCTGHFWEGRFKAQPLVDVIGLLLCAIYIDLNPMRALIACSPEQSKYTSAYDRIEGQKGVEISSAAFDLKPISDEQATEQLRDMPLQERREQRREKQRNPSGRQIRRDAWLSPLPLRHTADDPEVHQDGLRASDKGYLEFELDEYLTLLRATAALAPGGEAPAEGDDASAVPEELQSILSRLGVELSTWGELVWNFKHYYGSSGCVGGPEQMATFATSSGHRWTRGQRRVAACFS